MKIDKEKVYAVKLSGWQIKTIEQALSWGLIHEAFSEKGVTIAESTLKDLKGVEELKGGEHDGYKSKRKD